MEVLERPEWETVVARCRLIEQDALRKLACRGLPATDSEFERGQLAAVLRVLTLAKARQQELPEGDLYL